MKVVYTKEAIGDLERLRAFLMAKSPMAAKKMATNLRHGINHLKRFPKMGLPVQRAPDPERIRDLIKDDYVVRYLIQREHIEVPNHVCMKCNDSL
uniref:Plasmid stabilization system n=1 Tax=Magnetococcus massalia (strain MO-1) TaxID=451514 RepID=A0A1S7LJI4_MAGMO|nr:Conserved protein of unknown function [Candidatus Magnetococcus massalia]